MFPAKSSLPTGVEQGATMLPRATLDRRFRRVGRCSIRQHDKAIAEVLMDVSAHERI